MTWEHHGWEIAVDHRGEFYAEDPHPDSIHRKIHADTLEGARKAVDRRLANQRKQQAHELNLPVITTNGTEGVVRGINIASEHLLGIDENGGYGGSILPDTPWIRAQVAEVKDLQERRIHLLESLKAFAVPPKFRITDDNYPAAVAHLKTIYTEALLAAEAEAEKEQERPAR